MSKGHIGPAVQGLVEIAKGVICPQHIEIAKGVIPHEENNSSYVGSVLLRAESGRMFCKGTWCIVRHIVVK